MTITEVCKKFKGEAKDELRKHLNRVEFLESNPKNFKRVIGFIPDKSKIFDRLVTNTIVPMQFLKDLPIESSKIGPINLDNINKKIRNNESTILSV